MRIVKSLLVGLGLVVVLGTTAFALSAQGYRSNEPLKNGLAVSLAEDQAGGKSSLVELASVGNQKRFVGITVPQNEATVTTTKTDSNVYVVANGEVTATVSDIGGKIKEGDNLVLSPLKGVLIKATADETTAIGVALEAQTDENSTTEKVNNRGNPDFETQLSTILVDVNPKAINPAEQNSSFLILFGESLTGKEVGAVQVASALVIFILVLIIEGSIIYGSIYSSIIALGRNPLSKSAVYKDLVQVTVLAVAILVAGIAAIYLVLWA